MIVHVLAFPLRSICACAFGLSPTSVLPGNVGSDESQRPLHTLFLPILLCVGGRPKVGEEEGELPVGLVAVRTAMHCVEQRLCAILCPQAAGSRVGKEEERTRWMLGWCSTKEKHNVWVCLIKQARMCCSLSTPDPELGSFPGMLINSAEINACMIFFTKPKI